MSITLFHINYDLDREERLRLTVPSIDDEGTKRIEAAIRIMNNGGYHEAAVIDTDDLDHAYALTQNGLHSDSWSQFPPEGVIPSGPGYIDTPHGKFGYKSSEVGDVLVKDGVAYVVDTLGFAEVGVASEVFTLARFSPSVAPAP